jgi:hypothetical protein
MTFFGGHVKFPIEPLGPLVVARRRLLYALGKPSEYHFYFQHEGHAEVVVPSK